MRFPRRGDVSQGDAHELCAERDTAGRQRPAAELAAGERREHEAAHRCRGGHEQLGG